MMTHLFKFVLRLTIILASLLICSISAAKTIEEKANSQVDRWNNEVALTRIQKQTVKTLATNFAQFRDSINEIKSIPLVQRMEIIEAENAAFMLSVENILTTSQKRQLATKKAQRATNKNEALSQKANQESTQNKTNNSNQ